LHVVSSFQHHEHVVLRDFLQRSGHAKRLSVPRACPTSSQRAGRTCRWSYHERLNIAVVVPHATDGLQRQRHALVVRRPERVA
jgi:hypothetical protein